MSVVPLYGPSGLGDLGLAYQAVHVADDGAVSYERDTRVWSLWSQGIGIRQIFRRGLGPLDS